MVMESICDSYDEAATAALVGTYKGDEGDRTVFHLGKDKKLVMVSAQEYFTGNGDVNYQAVETFARVARFEVCVADGQRYLEGHFLRTTGEEERAYGYYKIAKLTQAGMVLQDMAYDPKEVERAGYQVEYDDGNSYGNNSFVFRNDLLEDQQIRNEVLRFIERKKSIILEKVSN